MRSGAILFLLTAAGVLPAAAQPAPPPLQEATTPAASPVPAAPAPAEPDAAAAAVPTEVPIPQGSRLPDFLQTRIEEVRRGNRVTEVRVTGPDGEVRYTMDNPPAPRPPTPDNAGNGLSAPSFLRIEF